MRNTGRAVVVIVAVALVGGCEALERDRSSLLLVSAGANSSLARVISASVRAQYIHEPLVSGIRPFAGLDVTNRGSIYVFGGAGVDIDLLDPVIVSPGIGIGYYREGHGPDLGGHLHFRTGGEITYAFDGGQRFGLTYAHISNAGLVPPNPGLDTLGLVYEIPLGSD